MTSREVSSSTFRKILSAKPLTPILRTFPLSLQFLQRGNRLVHHLVDRREFDIVANDQVDDLPVRTGF